MKSIAVLICCISMVSCAITPVSYKEPLDGPLATIKFVNQSAGVSSVEFFKEQETCKGREISDPIPPNGSKDINVWVGATISFSYGYTYVDSSCRIYVTFLPEESKQYIATLSRDYESGGCELSFFEPGGERVIHIQREGISNVWDENSSFCE